MKTQNAKLISTLNNCEVNISHKGISGKGLAGVLVVAVVAIPAAIVLSLIRHLF